MKQYITLLMIGVLSACNIFNARIEGNGNIQSTQFNFSGFENISVEDIFKVKIIQSELYSVTAMADENLLEYIDIDKNGKTLRIRINSNSNLNPTQDIEVQIAMPEINKANISGASDLEILQEFKQNKNLSISVSGASHGKVFVSAPTINVNVSGASELALKGQSGSADIDVYGASQLKAYPFKSNNTQVSASGASHAEISAAGQLNAEASGASHINYREIGSVTVSQKSSGASSVSKVN